MKTRSLSAARLLVALALPLPAAAQAIRPRSGAIQTPSQPTATAGSIQGTVQELSLPRGMVTIETGGGIVTLRGTPAQLDRLNPGDAVRFPYASFQGALWVAPKSANFTSAMTGNHRQQGTVRGTVQQVGTAQGTITLGGNTFRIHPLALEGVVPGQFVSLGYATVGGSNWVSHISPLAGGAVPQAEVRPPAGIEQPGLQEPQGAQQSPSAQQMEPFFHDDVEPPANVSGEEKMRSLGIEGGIYEDELPPQDVGGEQRVPTEPSNIQREPGSEQGTPVETPTMEEPGSEQQQPREPMGMQQQEGAEQRQQEQLQPIRP